MDSLHPFGVFLKRDIAGGEHLVQGFDRGFVFLVGNLAVLSRIGEFFGAVRVEAHSFVEGQQGGFQFRRHAENAGLGLGHHLGRIARLDPCLAYVIPDQRPRLDRLIEVRQALSGGIGGDAQGLELGIGALDGGGGGFCRIGHSVELGDQLVRGLVVARDLPQPLAELEGGEGGCCGQGDGPQLGQAPE